MYRVLNRGLLNNKPLSNLTKCVSRELKFLRYVTTQNTRSESLFPERVDFPSRHIGPRDQDIVTMLDSLGYKVGNYLHR